MDERNDVGLYVFVLIELSRIEMSEQKGKAKNKKVLIELSRIEIRSRWIAPQK